MSAPYIPTYDAGGGGGGTTNVTTLDAEVVMKKVKNAAGEPIARVQAINVYNSGTNAWTFSGLYEDIAGALVPYTVPGGATLVDEDYAFVESTLVERCIDVAGVVTGHAYVLNEWDEAANEYVNRGTFRDQAGALIPFVAAGGETLVDCP
mgnify:CR=1 FL=1